MSFCLCQFPFSLRRCYQASTYSCFYTQCKASEGECRLQAGVYADLATLQLPFALAAEVGTAAQDPALDKKWDFIRAQCLLKVLQSASPLHSLNDELRSVYLSHQRLLGRPAVMPPGQDFGSGRRNAAELVGMFLKVEAEKTKNIILDSVGFSLIFDGAHKKRLRVPPEAFIIRDVDEDGYLRYRTLGFTYPTVQQYADFKKETCGVQEPEKGSDTFWSQIEFGKIV